MATARGFSGPRVPGARRLLANPTHHRRLRNLSLRLPRSVRRDLALISGSVRRAEQGERGVDIGEVAEVLLRRATMGPTGLDRDRIARLGYRAWLEEQLDPEALDDSELEEELASQLPTITMSAADLRRIYSFNLFIPVFELWAASLMRACYSRRQLFERCVIFWTDHFNIDALSGDQFYLQPPFHRDVIRRHAMSNFPDLLSATAHSAAMMVYLTNDTNFRNHPNENYARELMELHTMGRDRGYTQQDVREVARCFTGWTWHTPGRGIGEIGTFRFSTITHDTESKRVLGRTIPAGGDISDGERVLEIVANRRETGEFLAAKLLRYFWGYEPDRAAIRTLARVYRDSDGNIRSLLRAALRQRRLATATPKLKRPFHLVVSAVRALGATVERPDALLGHISAAGHQPFAWSPPDGYPDTAQYWGSFALPRLNFGATLLGRNTRAVTLDPTIDSPVDSPAQIADRIDAALLGGRMSTSTRRTLVEFLGRSSRTRSRVGQAIGLALNAPEFQEY